MLIIAFQAMKNAALEIEGQPVPNWISDAISQLSTIRTNAERMCLELTKNRKNPALMKLDPKRDYPERIVAVILDQENTTQGEQSLTAHCPCSGEAAWNSQDPKMLLRFLVYSYVLSKYKRFSVTEDGGCCRLATELAAEESRRLSAPYWDTRNEDYTQPKSARILAELTSLQCWLSKVSCDWLRTVSYTAPPESVYSQVLRMSFQESKKGIVSAACFPTFLLLRALWASSFGTIILLDRHFCSQGWHFNVFHCHLRYVSTAMQKPPYNPIDWDIQETSLQNLQKHQDKASPSLVMMGNSIDGKNSDYTARVLSQKTGCPKAQPHREHDCAENAHHVSIFLSSDHDTLSTAFFAAHRQYAFPVQDRSPEEDVIQRLMGSMHEHPRAATLHSTWRELRASAKALGADKENLAIIGCTTSAMCHGDIGLITYIWRQDSLQPVVNVTSHQCVNWEKLYDWSQDRAVDMLKPGWLIHPTKASTDSDETSVEALATTPAADGPDVPALSDLFVPFADIPDWTGPIVTLRAAVVGVLGGVLVNASNIYIGLRAGWTTSANVLGAIVSFTVLKRASSTFGPHENKIAQTMATASGGMSNVFISGMPALYQLNFLTTPAKDFVRLVILTTIGGYFGLLSIVPFK
ncbi:oligopeptide transporter [Akanthomyces lecanii RCEF 1005]|uniref:Oligopeptide transporter n=1 Tax=Akanthomyces lecanii RCEF 1005 TaxID=1081108 RepID=A0A162N2Z8_CORDF|nr:oligopeptide transporter [Akanthomyces lecanii RCEF 1005]